VSVPPAPPWPPSTPPQSLAAGLAEHGPEALWERLARTDRHMAGYRPGHQLDTGQLTARFVIPADDSWPTALDALGDAAPLGDLGTRDRRPARTVHPRDRRHGNRHATDRAKSRAALIAGDLTAAGRTVTASLAYGIDTAAHTGAHLVPAPTIAVLPCGLDLCHPHDHGDLLRAADRGGAAVSAYRPGTPASRITLRTTAQLIAALSTAVVPVEVIARSPAMEAADTAHQLDRPVLVLPPDEPGGPYSTGTAQLLEPGRARPGRDADDILTAIVRIQKEWA
jgi:DNA processing protein